MRTIRATLAMLMLGGAVCAAWGQQPAGPKPAAPKDRKPVPWPATWAKIIDEKVIFKVTKELGVATDRAPGPMKLSPDGKRLLYVRRRVLKPDEQGRIRWGHDLILLNLETRQEKLLPVPSYVEPCNEMLLWMLSVNIFDADGKRIVLGAGVDQNKNGQFDGRKERQQLAIYDIPQDRLNRLDLFGQRLVATFDSRGRRLIVCTAERRGEDAGIYITPADKLKPKKLSFWGLPLSTCPVSDVMVLLLPSGREGPRDAGEPISSKLVLYDLKRERVIAMLPTYHEDTQDLEQYSPQWTADGRFLYYIDVAAGSGGIRWKRRQLLTRVWDRKANKISRIIPNMVAIGPGPTATTMMLTSSDRGQGLAIHDPESHTAWLVRGQWVRVTGTSGDVVSFSGPAARPIIAQGNYILYIRRLASQDWAVCRGRIELPLPKQAAGEVGEMPMAMIQRKVSSPREALRNMARAVRYGNKYAFVACFDVSAEHTRKLAAVARLKIAQTRLFQAIMTAYGPDALEERLRERLTDESWIENINFKISDDKATCIVQPVQSAKHFVKKDGSWKIVADDVAALSEEGVVLLFIAAEMYKAAMEKIDKEGYTSQRILEELDLPAGPVKKTKPPTAPTTGRGD